MYGFIISILITAVGFSLLLVICKNDRKLFYILLFALMIRMALLWLDHFVFMSEYLEGIDAGGFHTRAMEFYNLGIGGLFSEIPAPGSRTYSWSLAFVYHLFGSVDWIIPRAINALFGVFAVYYSFKLSKLFWGDRIAYQNAIILTIFPFLIIHSIFLNRESFVVFFLALGVYLLARWYNVNNTSYLFGGMIALLGSAMFHAGMAIALIAISIALFVRLCWFVYKKKPVSFLKLSMLFLMAIAGFGILLLSATAIANLMQSGGLVYLTDIRLLVDARSEGFALARGRAAYLVGFNPSSPIDILWHTPIRVLYFLFTPFPWMMQSPLDLIGVADAIFYILLFIGIFKSLTLITKDQRKWFILVVIFFLILAFAWGTSNYGTAIRHRSKFLVILLPLAASFPGIRSFKYVANDQWIQIKSTYAQPFLNLFSKSLKSK